MYNFCVYIYLCFLGTHNQEWDCWVIQKLCLKFWRIAKLFKGSSYTISSSYQQNRKVTVSLYPHQHVLFFVDIIVDMRCHLILVLITSSDGNQFFVLIQFSSVVQSCLTLYGPMNRSTPGLPCPSPTAGVHPNPCPLSWWYHPTISSCVIPFSSGPQSFPSGSFKWVSSLHQVTQQSRLSY